MLPRNAIATAIVLVAAALVLGETTASAATNPPGMPPRGKVMLGLGGTATTPVEFGAKTRAPHEIHLVSVGWNEQRAWVDALRPRLEQATAGGYRLMVHISPQRVSDGKEGRSPGAVSRGDADAYLLDMSRVLNESNQFVYVRPPAEMNVGSPGTELEFAL